MPSKQEINAMSPTYQANYKEKVRDAIDKYLAWMNLNTKGYRFFTRITHLTHGGSGQKRAAELKLFLERENNFYAVVEKVGSTLAKSSFSEHALRRYLFQTMTGILAIDVKPVTTESSFYKQANKFVDDELLKIKTVKSEIADAPPPYNPSAEIPVEEEISPWTLTESVRRDIFEAEWADYYGNAAAGGAARVTIINTPIQYGHGHHHRHHGHHNHGSNTSHTSHHHHHH